MTRAYYNENDEFAADWLRNLIKAGLIADGEVDTRSIVDVRPDDIRGFTQCHFFAGIGGWSYALRKAGWDDSRPAWTGSCPCQPFSLAGAQRGFADERHLWPVWRELIRECDPSVVFGEQVASATAWLRLVRGDLEEMGRAVGAMPIQAASAGADHLRDRYWFVAYTTLSASPRQRRDSREVLPEQKTNGRGGTGDMGNAGRAGLAFRSIAEIQPGDLRSEGSAAASAGNRSEPMAYTDQPGAGTERQQRSGQQCGPGCHPEPCLSNVADARGGRCLRSIEGQGQQPGRTEAERPSDLDWVVGADGKARRVKSGIRLLAHGVPNRVGLLRGFGNAIDPRPAAAFIEAYMTASMVSSQDQGG